MSITAFDEEIRRKHAYEMLIGEYTHNLDPKKRLSIPSKFRRELGESAILTVGFDSCLFVFPMKSWQKLEEKMENLSFATEGNRSFARLMLAGANEIEFDSLGRILIPDHLKAFASLEKSVVITGLLNRLEIWDQKKWAEYKAGIHKNSDKIAEKLGEMGIV